MTVQPALAAAALAALAWIDPLYLPLITLGPLLAGAVAGTAGVPPRSVALVWGVAGVFVLLVDLVVNGEDVAFHAVVAVSTAGLGYGAAAAGRRLRGRRPAAT